MSRPRVGVRLEALRLPLRRALHEVERMGVGGVQVDAVGDLAPKRLSQTGRREFRHLLRAHNLELTALGCPLRHGLDEPTQLQARIEHVQSVMALSFDLGARVAIVAAGPIPADAGEPGAATLAESLHALAAHGDRIGAVLALEAGLEAGDALRAFLDRFDTGGLGVNFNPANLLLHGFDPVEGVKALRGRIVHAHAKDAARARVGRTAREVALGHGDIDWLQMLAALEEAEYRGWLTVDYEGAIEPVAQVGASVEFLRRLGLT